jgi:biopolymer transport protein TolQ
MTYFICEGNPFFNAYTESDLLGKVIFVLLLLLSVVTWTVLIQKIWLTKNVKRDSYSFRKLFIQNEKKPLDELLLLNEPKKNEYPNAFAIIYNVLRTKTLEIFEKNGNQSKKQLLPSDIALLQTTAGQAISSLSTFLGKNLYILSTIVTLAPFLGLLGTVYGILTTFTELGAHQTGGSNQAILGGLSLALSTTVLGLIDAIPAIVGYNYLKQVIYHFDGDMQHFATELLSSIELEHRKEEL